MCMCNPDLNQLRIDHLQNNNIIQKEKTNSLIITKNGNKPARHIPSG